MEGNLNYRLLQKHITLIKKFNEMEYDLNYSLLQSILCP